MIRKHSQLKELSEQPKVIFFNHSYFFIVVVNLPQKCLIGIGTRKSCTKRLHKKKESTLNPKLNFGKMGSGN